MEEASSESLIYLRKCQDANGLSCFSRDIIKRATWLVSDSPVGANNRVVNDQPPGRMKKSIGAKR